MIFHHAQRYELFSTIPNVYSDFLEDFTTFFAYRIDEEFPFLTFDVTAVESNVEKLESNVISANAISQTKSIYHGNERKRKWNLMTNQGRRDAARSGG